MQDSNLSSKQSSLHNNIIKKILFFFWTGAKKTGKGPAPFQKKAVFMFLILALIGFADATYLTLKHFNGTAITCSLSQGCDEVTSSVYSELFGIPVALLGSLYYLSIILLSVHVLDKQNTQVLYLISKLTWFGLSASAYFIFVQASVLHAWCQYCIGSAITSTLLFLVGMTYLKKTSFPILDESAKIV